MLHPLVYVFIQCFQIKVGNRTIQFANSQGAKRNCMMKIEEGEMTIPF